MTASRTETMQADAPNRLARMVARDETEPSVRERGSTLVLAVAASWFAASLLQATVLAAQEELAFVYSFFASGFYYGILAALTPLIWRACARMSIRRRSVAALVGWHAALLVSIVGTWLGVYAGLLFLIAGPVAVEGQFVGGGLWAMLQLLLCYGIVVSATLTLQASRRLRRQEAREAKLRLLAREAELGALRAQLRPHVLFNVLNSIYALIPERPTEAQRMVELVGDLMRQTLDRGADELITLEEELDLVSSYLEIEQTRFGDALRVEWRIDESTRGTLVPPFLLQPLVENAVKHGIARRLSGGTITIDISPSSDRFVVSIRDRSAKNDVDAATTPDASIVDGHGFEITRGRLKAWFGDDARLVATRHDDEFEARIEIPMQRLIDDEEALGAPAEHV